MVYSIKVKQKRKREKKQITEVGFLSPLMFLLRIYIIGHEKKYPTATRESAVREMGSTEGIKHGNSSAGKAGEKTAVAIKDELARYSKYFSIGSCNC